MPSSPADTRSAKPTAPPMPSKYVGPEPEGADIEEQGLGWKNTFGNGNGADAITSGLEGAWTTNPIKWDNNYFENLFGYEWELTKSPAGAHQWTPKDASAAGTVPDAHDPVKEARADHVHDGPRFEAGPDLRARFRSASTTHPEELADAFAKAWFKLTHRDMGPVSRYLGPLVPAEPLLWQDPVPAVDHELIGEAGYCRSEGEDSRIRTFHLPTGHDGLGVGRNIPRQRQARRG